MEFFCVLRLRAIILLEVDMNVEAPAGVVAYRRGEGGVGRGFGGWGLVYVGFCVGAGGCSLAGLGVRIICVGD